VLEAEREEMSKIKKTVARWIKKISFLHLIDLKNRTVFLFSACLLLVIVGFVLVLVLFFGIANKILFLCLACLIVLSGIGGLVFYKTVYSPIIKIDQALHMIISAEPSFEISIDEKNELYPVVRSLNQLIIRLRGFVEREYNEKILRKQIEINALQSQINPHFLYNALDSIRGEALKQDASDIAHMTKALSNLFRYAISYDSNLVSFRDELENINNYMIVQQYRFNNRFSLKSNIEVNREFNLLDYKLPRMTLQPIVENAVFHGLETKVGNGIIWIHAYATEKRIIITIEDDGIGIAQDEMNRLNESFAQPVSFLKEDAEISHKSIALPNINSRIKMLFGDEYGLRIRSTALVGTSVEIVLPFNEKEPQ
jgi:two-component system sensor histidine kinase YesM